MGNKYLPVLFWGLILVQAALGSSCPGISPGSDSTCSDVLAVPNSEISFVVNSSGFFAIATCSEGYDIYGDSVVQCIDGEWQDLNYICLANDTCDYVPTILNGKVTINQDCESLTATITCDEGFEPSGPTELICYNGDWFNGTTTICQSSAHTGKHFAVVFLRATSRIDGNVIKDIIITTEDTANVSFASDFGPHFSSKTISGNGVQAFDPSFTIQTKGDSEKAVVINSDEDINVQVHSYRVKGGQVAMDSYYALPITFEGNNEYFIITPGNTDMFAVIALQDNIVVDIYKPGVLSLTITMDLYDVYHCMKGDFSGTRINCSADCSVVGGFYFTPVPQVSGSASSDAGIVQYVPTSDYYTFCLTGPPYPDKVHILKALARYDGTTVTFYNNNNPYSHYLDSGEEYTFFVDDYPTLVTSDNDILVAQFSLTTKVTHRGTSDPSLLLCLSPSQYGNNYKFRTVSGFGTKRDRCFLRCIIRSDYRDDLLLNQNNLIELKSYTLQVPGGEEYSFIYAELQHDTAYTLSSCSGEPFSADYYCQRKVGQITARIGRVY